MKPHNLLIIAVCLLCMGALRTMRHRDLSGLYNDDHPQYVRKDGTRPLQSDWNAGAYTITAQGLDVTDIDFSGQLTSTAAIGTAPFIITSTTLNTNLNADLWDGYQFSDYLDQAVKSTSSPTFAAVTTGDVTFSGGGLAYGEIYAQDVSDTIAFTGSGIDNKIQITSFAVEGVSNNTDPNHPNDHITISQTGVYKITCSMVIKSDAGTGFELGVSVFKNNGAAAFANLHFHSDFAGGGGDEKVMSADGLVTLAANDTVEVWCWNETNTTSIIIDEINLNLVQIGG